MYWTEKEIDFLKEFYPNKDDLFLSKSLGRSPNSIRIKASRLNIPKLVILRLKERYNIKFNEIQKQIMFGSLMGDMYCGGKKNARIVESHGKNQEEYLLWKVSILNNLTFNLRRNKQNGNLCVESKFYPCITYFWHLFYRPGKKIVNLDILNQINSLGLAVWYMDDGSYRKRDRRCCLYTDCFTYEENLIMKKWFEKKWDVFPKIYFKKDPKRHPGKKWYYLSFSVSETKKFIKIVGDHIHPSMKYKVGEMS